MSDVNAHSSHCASHQLSILVTRSYRSVTTWASIIRRSAGTSAQLRAGGKRCLSSPLNDPPRQHENKSPTAYTSCRGLVIQAKLPGLFPHYPQICYVFVPDLLGGVKRDHKPADKIDQDSRPPCHPQQRPGDAHNGRVDVEVLRHAARHAADHLVFA